MSILILISAKVTKFATKARYFK